jgi:hypothetical protein
MHRYPRLMMAVGGVVALTAACAPVEPSAGDPESVRAARSGQADPDAGHDWEAHSFEINDNPVFDLLVVGGLDVGQYDRNTEYWYVHSSELADLGVEDLEMTSRPGNGDGLIMGGDQEFTQPVYLTWERFTTDPVSDGVLYSDPTGEHFLRIDVDSGEFVRIVWYQIIDDTNPTNIDLVEGTYTPVSGSVSIPSGQYGYYIDATID